MREDAEHGTRCLGRESSYGGCQHYVLEFFGHWNTDVSVVPNLYIVMRHPNFTAQSGH